MNFKLIKPIALLLLALLALPANAVVTCSANSCTGPINEMVTSIFAAPEGDAIFAAAAVKASLGCESQYNTFVLPGSYPTFAQTYQTALTAIALNKVVTLRRDMTKEACTIWYLRMETE